MSDCILCKILRNELPSHKIYEDENTLAILDIFPRSNGHTLILPKRHCSNFSDLTDLEASQLIITGKKVLNAINNSEVLSQGANLLLNENAIAGQEIMHAHLHLIPRSANDNLKFGLSSVLKKERTLDFTSVKNKIKKYIN